MLLAEAGKIDLDAPISTYLTRWELPESGFDNDQVSVRRLLSHTAGLVDGLGFGDYEADEALPTLEESLSRPRGSDDEQAQIELGREPGSEWDYSGGGYLILQLIVEEVSGMSFGQYMQSAVFEPLGMTRSTYGYLGDLGNISGSYDRQGNPAPLYRYAAAGATGLSSSAADLSRFAQAQIPGSSVAPVLPLASVAAMREPHGREMGADIWGLGTMLFAPTAEGSFVFGHDGANDPSINSSVRINPDNGDAIIALSTGPAYLASRITYEWVLWQTGFPDFIQSNLAIESAKRPMNIGLLVIAVGTIVMLVRQRRRRSPQADRESRQ
jgi:CubicO group peptidase (beta-lactamase class C family)